KERPKLSCPLTDCHKQYKVTGWLTKHLLSCHPEEKLLSGKWQQVIRATTPLQTATGGEFIGKFVCNVPGCTKSLGSEKGIRNHRYEKHNWSFARSASLPVTPVRRDSYLTEWGQNLLPGQIRTQY
ncbi:unnamed protein product, partial [Hymenolepis diminuta]